MFLLFFFFSLFREAVSDVVISLNIEVGLKVVFFLFFLR
jgi:hypothetical protein